MRKLMTVGLIGIGLLLAFAAPAFAQARDPFDPVVTESQVVDPGTETGTITQGGTGTVTTSDPTVVGGTGSDGLAATGAETEPWLVLAFMLIVVGAGALAYSKVATRTA